MAFFGKNKKTTRKLEEQHREIFGITKRDQKKMKAKADRARAAADRKFDQKKRRKRGG